MEAQKQRLSGNLSAEQLELLNNPNSAVRAQDLYGKALSRLTAVLHDLGGELAVAAGVRPGYLYLGRNWLGMAFDNKLAGQVEGTFITSGRSFTSLLQRAY